MSGTFDVLIQNIKPAPHLGLLKDWNVIKINKNYQFKEGFSKL